MGEAPEAAVGPDRRAGKRGLILSRSGTQNLGGYNGGLGVGERDLTYDFAVTAGETYKLQVLFFMTGTEHTGMRIAVEGVNVADNIDLFAGTDHATEGIVYTATFEATDDTLQLLIGRRTDGGGSSIGDVNAITLELISELPASGYGTWAGTNAPDETPDQDHDNDGVANGIEYFMGVAPGDLSFTALPGLDPTHTVTWPMDPAYDGTWRVETSPDLRNWTDVTADATDHTTSVSYTLPPNMGTRFVRLAVTPN